MTYSYDSNRTEMIVYLSIALVRVVGDDASLVERVGRLVHVLVQQSVYPNLVTTAVILFVRDSSMSIFGGHMFMSLNMDKLSID